MDNKNVMWSYFDRYWLILTDILTFILQKITPLNIVQNKTRSDVAS